MRGGMRVATDHGHAWQGCALLRADDVNNTLTDVRHIKFGYPKVRAVFIQRLHLQTGHRIGNALITICGWHVMIGYRQIPGNAPGFAASQTQAVKSLRGGHFMQQLPVYVYQTGAVIFRMDNMIIPKFVV